MDTVRYLNDLPRNVRVAIYPNNSEGKVIKKVLEDKRPDVNVLCFMNTNEGGECEGLRVFTPESVPVDVKGKIDLVLIAKLQAAAEIKETLSTIGLDGALCFISNLCFHGPHVYDAHIKHADKVDRILQCLCDERDKGLFLSIVEAFSSLSVYELSQFYEDEIENLQYFEFDAMNRGDFVVEGGVYDGVTTAAFLDRVGPAGRVFAFDPLGEEHLSEALTSHPCYDVCCTLVPKALGERNGKMKLNSKGPSSTVGAEGEHDIEIITIDDFVGEVAGRVDFIKLDIEGGELSAIKGGMDAIRKCRPTLAVSIYHGADQFFEVPFFLMNNLDGYSYRLGLYTPRGTEVVLYCLPKERTC